MKLVTKIKYDTNIEMASPDVRAFHDGSRLIGRNTVLARIHSGTKASSPQMLNKRHQVPYFMGFPTNPASAGVRMFEQGYTQAWKPLTQSLNGGVLRNYKYARMALDSRANQYRGIREASQTGLPPSAAAPAVMAEQTLRMSDKESKELELSNLLNTLQDAAEVGELPSSQLPDMKNILRLFASLAPTFTDEDLAEYAQFFNELIQQLDEHLEENELSQGHTLVRNFAARLALFIDAMAKNGMTSKTPKERSLIVKEALKRIFKVDPGKLGYAPPKTAAEDPYLASKRAERLETAQEQGKLINRMRDSLAQSRRDIAAMPSTAGFFEEAEERGMSHTERLQHVLDDVFQHYDEPEEEDEYARLEAADLGGLSRRAEALRNQALLEATLDVAPEQAAQSIARGLQYDPRAWASIQRGRESMRRNDIGRRRFMEQYFDFSEPGAAPEEQDYGEVVEANYGVPLLSYGAPSEDLALALPVASYGLPQGREEQDGEEQDEEEAVAAAAQVAPSLEIGEYSDSDLEDAFDAWLRENNDDKAELSRGYTATHKYKKDFAVMSLGQIRRGTKDGWKKKSKEGKVAALRQLGLIM